MLFDKIAGAKVSLSAAALRKYVVLLTSQIKPNMH